jgi:hypothetical protein
MVSPGVLLIIGSIIMLSSPATVLAQRVWVTVPPVYYPTVVPIGQSLSVTLAPNLAPATDSITITASLAVATVGVTISPASVTWSSSTSNPSATFTVSIVYPAPSVNATIIFTASDTAASSFPSLTDITTTFAISGMPSISVSCPGITTWLLGSYYHQCRAVLSQLPANDVGFEVRAGGTTGWSMTPSYLLWTSLSPSTTLSFTVQTAISGQPLYPPTDMFGDSLTLSTLGNQMGAFQIHPVALPIPYWQGKAALYLDWTDSRFATTNKVTGLNYTLNLSFARIALYEPVSISFIS